MKKNTYRQYSIIVGTAVILLGLGHTAYAQAPSITYNVLAPVGTYFPATPSLTQYLEGMFRALIGIAGLLAVFMIVLGGIQYIGSAVPSAKESAKQKVIGAIFGLLLAIFSWVLLAAINPSTVASNVTIAATPAVPLASTSPTAVKNGPGWFFDFTAGGTPTFSGPIPKAPTCTLVRDNMIDACNISGSCVVTSACVFVP